jgi:hypothetical protein
VEQPTEYSVRTVHESGSHTCKQACVVTKHDVGDDGGAGLGQLSREGLIVLGLAINAVCTGLLAMAPDAGSNAKLWALHRVQDKVWLSHYGRKVLAPPSMQLITTLLIEYAPHQ